MADPLADFTRDSFTAEGKTKDIYRIGSGPCVIVMSEIPGITPKVADVARQVAAIGCSATMPNLFGQAGREPTQGYMLSSVFKGCISREFTVLAQGRTSPVIAWLRALAAHEHERCGGPGVGAIGMCFTGGFALAMMVDDRMLAPVLSQPSLPFGLTKSGRSDLGLSPVDLIRIKQRAAQGQCVMGLRFSGDKLSPPERFETLRRELGDKFIAIELDSSEGNPHGHPTDAHSVVTEHLADGAETPTRAALDQVLNFYRERLLAS